MNLNSEIIEVLEKLRRLAEIQNDEIAELKREVMRVDNYACELSSEFAHVRKELNHQDREMVALKNDVMDLERKAR
jgi:predicted RNase H-like nuclease (RuvC/YqgF family)